MDKYLPGMNDAEDGISKKAYWATAIHLHHLFKLAQGSGSSAGLDGEEVAKLARYFDKKFGLGSL